MDITTLIFFADVMKAALPGLAVKKQRSHGPCQPRAD